jgi:hypothetical protein
MHSAQTSLSTILGVLMLVGLLLIASTAIAAELVSVNHNGTDSGNGLSLLWGPSPTGPSALPVISADSRFLTFISFASDLGPTDNNGKNDVYVRDLQLGMDLAR